MKKTIYSFTCVMCLVFVCPTIKAQTKDRLPCIDKKFSIVAHIVLDSLGVPSHSTASIYAAVAALNTEFSPICVSFEVCSIDSIENFRYNILYDQPNPNHWQEMQTLYHIPKRINIYYVKDIKMPAGAAGFAGLGCITNLTSNGIVLKDNSALPHEMGHYFGLSHTFEGGGGQSTELADGSNCSTSGDEICDTPADPYINPENTANYVNGTCEFISLKKDANGDYYNPIVTNIMSYYPCSCQPRLGFTHQQYKKMAETYLANPGMW
jgi:hypothetical protein